MRLSVFIAVSFSIISCNENNAGASVAKNNIDTLQIFVKDIPIIKEGPRKGDTIFEFRHITKSISKFNLDKLENGFDSLNIRIWLGHSMSPKHYILSLQRKNSKWIGKLTITVEERYGENGKKLENQSVEHKYIVPKSGWTEFIAKIFSLQILTLPDETELVGYNGCGGDGLPFYFEIATEHKYRFFSYCGIESNLEEFPEANNVNRIAKLLESEFEFRFAN